VRGLLRLPAFGRLLTAYTINEIAYTFGSLALTVFVYRRTGSPLATAGYFLCAQFVPALIAPLLVARIDHVPPALALPALYWVETAVFAGLALVTGHFSLAVVLALALTDGAMAITARSVARAASVAVLSPAGRLEDGNALINGAFSVCYMASPAVAGVAVAGAGVRLTLVAAAGLFGLVGLSLVGTRGIPRQPVEEQRAERAGARLRAGLAYVWRHPAVRSPILLQGLAIVAFTISIPVEIVFARRSLHVGGAGYGALLTVWGAGAIAGSVVYARWRRASGRALVAGSAVALGAGFAVMAAAPNLAVALAGAAVAGSGNGVEAAAARTLLQQRVRPEWMGLAMAVNESVYQAAPGGGILLGGGIAALAGPRVALAAAAAGSLAMALGAWLFLGGPPVVAAAANEGAAVAEEGPAVAEEGPAAAEEGPAAAKDAPAPANAPDPPSPP
jgi:hypothetical protein